MKKWQKYISILLAIGACYALLIIGLLFSQTKATPAEDVQTLLVLGAQIRGKDETEAYPSPVLKERLDAAFDYWTEHPKITIIVSGGKGADEPTTEAAVMSSYLIDKGIPKNSILLEDQSKRTQENIQFSNERYTLDKVAVVTNDFHMYRAQMLAKRQGVTQVSGLSAKSKTSATVSNYLREILALGYGFLFDW
ncbi:hypothetical protein BAU15_09175 [Enterococcus sp. JM4C]|uniref:YdcF family protein n=1 Tax=Candidatus Enterococcus huntleyi TaxID=1857217 RepID=UPI0013797A98|nr:YdcF family protein [Enterococcus sp. JM4C]KAF1296807.1 hypothetical protein BAU15_09175 [Enterococcus sp. JM4C]